MAAVIARPPHRRRPVVEELEARILYAADLAPFVHPLTDGAQVRVLEAPAATPAPTLVEQAATTRHEIVFVDPGVADWTRLVADLQAQQDADRQLDVVLLDAGRDGVAQITGALQGLHDIAAIHLISHGEAGAVMLGSTRLDLASIDAEAARIADWAPALQAGADILVYGCDVAASADGQALLARLRALSGADIAASTDLTGAARLGGDWTLEYSLGAIQARVAADVPTQADWQGVLATYTVTNTNDSGAGSFRQAIQDANANPGADTINFNIAGTGIHTITLSSMLPYLSGQVNIDATTDDSFAANGNRPAIAIDGDNTIQDGLELYGGSDGSVVRGLIIERFTQDGIDIASSGNNTVAGNWIGLNTAGTAAAGNQQGVNIWSANNNTVGGTTAADRNVIAGNTGPGIFVGGGSTGTHIYGNYIGTDKTGTVAIANQVAGVELMSSGTTVGGTTSAYRNLISGNTVGVAFYAGGSSNTVLGNYIGTDVTGSVALANVNYGVQINSDASYNVIGGTSAGARNLISGNTNYGVAIMDPGAVGNQVEGNWIGVNAAGTAALSNLVGVILYNSTSGNTVGGTSAGAGNVISGNSVDGIQIFGSATGNTIQGNLVGLNPGGTSAIANTNQGIALFGGASNTLIGGTTSAARNVISGNGNEGIRIEDAGTTGNLVQGNYIGTNAAGSAGVGNAVGVHVFNGATGNTVGGTAAGAGNLIAYNSGIGVSVTDSTTTGNVILSNSFTSNDGLAIDLGADGVTLNDVGDADTGPNNLTNFADLGSATTTGTELRLTGALSVAANTYYVIQVYSSPVGDPSGYGEGLTYLGAINVPSGPSGSVSGRYTLSVAVAAGSVITSTATRTDSSYTTYYETSEFSNQVVALAPGVTVTPVSTTTTEAGGTASFTVVLNAAPNATVTIPVSSSDTTEGSVSASSLSFTTSNWNTPQTVTVTGVDDTIVDGTVAYSAVLGAATSSDAAYNGLNPADVSLSNTDNDTYNTLTVTTAADTLDGTTTSIAALMANMGADGKISLREAITAANNTANGSGGPDRIAFGISGTGLHTINLGSALPNITDVVVIDGTTDDSFAANGNLPAIALNGASVTSGDGLHLMSGASGSTVRGLVIQGFANGYGVNIDNSANNQIVGNYIGTTLAGTAAVANFRGLYLSGAAATGNVIGGSTAADRNLISGNSNDGVSINGASLNTVIGNIVGLNAAGTAALGNGAQGIGIWGGAAQNTVGGTSAGLRNVISGNLGDGIRLDASTNNTVAGNYIGLASDGSTAVGNGEVGVNITNGATGNLIGGSTSASRNVISGNTQYGIYVDAQIGATANTTIQNNYLGTNAAGSAAVGNGGFGLAIDYGASNTSVLDNVISGNTATSWSASRGGIYVYANGATIQGNLIGLDATGTSFIPNGGGSSAAGIYEAGGSTSVLIGGTGVGQGNTIAGNTGSGVAVNASGNVRILGNAIYGNTGLGIDLDTNGVTANDAGDGDTGANHLQNFPVLGTVQSNGTNQISIAGTLNSNASSYYRVEFFASTSADGTGYGEGQTYLGYVNVATNGSGNASFSTVLSAVVPVGAYVSATATKSDASYATFTDTSEFALDVQAQTWNTAPVNTVPGAQTVNEDTALTITGLSVADAESNLSSTRLTVSSGTLTVSLAGGATIGAGANGSASLTLSGTPAQINAALATVSYLGTANFNGSDTLTILSTDSGALTDSDTVAITVTAVNDAPVLAGGNAFTTITEDQTSSSGDLVSALIAGQVTDADSGAASGIAVTATVSSTGTWQYSLDNGSTWNGVGSVSGNSALLLRSTDRLRFVPDGLNGTTASVTFRAWDQSSGSAGNKVDASTNGGTTAFSTATATSNLSVTAVNDAPVLAGGNAFTTITEDQTSSSGDLVSALIAGQVTDADSGAASGIAVTATVSSTGTWQYSLDNGSTWNGVGSVSGNSALLLRSTDRLRFVPDGLNGTTASVTFRAWDQSSGSAGNKVDASTNGGTTAFSTATATSNLSVTAVNDAPSMPGVALGSTPEDVAITWQVSTFAGYSSDVDAGALKGLAILVVDNSHGAWQYTLDGSNWTDIGTVSASHALLLAADATSAFRFVPAANWNGTTGMFVYEAWDQTTGTAGTFADASVTGGTSAFSGPSGSTLTVTPVNDPPVITSNGGGSTASVSVPENTTAVTTVTATDVDSPSLSFSLAGGADAALFTVNANSGVLSFISAPNFEVPTDANGDNQYVLVVQASDGSSTTTQTLTVTVTDVNEAPVVTSFGGASSAALSVPENQTAVTVVTATDPDTGANLTFSVTGGADAARFSIDPSSGALVFNTAPMVAAPSDANGDGVYLVTVAVSDGTLTASQSLSITVTRDGGISVVPAIASAGTEVRVNTSTANTQYGPDSDNNSVAMNDNGDTVVVWMSMLQDGSGYGVYGQRYDASGAAVGGEFQINQTTAGNQQFPSVAMAADGSFVVVWDSDQSNGGDIFMRRYGADGTALSGEVRVNTVTTNLQQVANVAMDASGNFIVVWDSNASGNVDVRAQRYSSTGTALGGEFTVNATLAGDQKTNSVAMDATGDFVVAWTGVNGDGSGNGVFAQRYNASGTAVGSQFQVNQITTGNQDWAHVAMDGHGGFVVVWQSAASDTGDVYARRYDGNGFAVTNEFRVNVTPSGLQNNPDVVMDAHGNFIVAWTSAGQDGSGNGVYGRRYSAGGVALGSEFLINVTTAGDQAFPHMALEADGDFVVEWEGAGTGDADGVFLRRFSAQGVTTEAGGTASFQVVLDRAPSAPVSIAVSSSNAADGTVSTASLVFTAANWNTPQTVTVTGVDNILVTPDASYTIVLGAAVSSDSVYNGIDPADVVLTHHNDDIAVTTTADVVDGDTSSLNALITHPGVDGRISLREAITAANATAGTDTIRFSIPDALAGGAHTLSLATDLPTVTDAVVIDGTTEPDFAGTPVVVLDGSGGALQGLEIAASGSTVRGLVIERFAQRGLLVDAGAANTRIVGNYIGTDVSGLLARGNGAWGIDLVAAGSGTVIGGTTSADRNVIGANTGWGGIAINGTPAATVTGNYIGVGADGVTALGNGIGVYLFNATAGSRIGGTAAGEGNLIGYNATGIAVQSAGSQAAILGNRYVANSGQAIDLGWDGVALANDTGDGDTGPNGLQNLPVIVLARSDGSSLLSLTGSFNSLASTAFRVEFYATPVNGGANGSGESLRYLGSVDVLTDASGNAPLAVGLGALVNPGEYVTATATRSDAGHTVFYETSELARNVAVLSTVQATVVVDTTSDAADGNVTSLSTLLADKGADGRISLREAILAANATANGSGGADRIDFSIPDALVGGVHTIAVSAALPTVSEAALIDATTEPDYAGTPVVVLDGSGAGSSADGLAISAGGSTVKGLTIRNFGHYGIYLTGGGGNLIAGNYIGTDASGAAAAANHWGIVVDNSAGNVIGGTTAAARNLISGNLNDGINLSGSGATGNLVEGNYIGTNAAGTAALGNAGVGVAVGAGASGNTIGGASASARNLISGNAEYGVFVSDPTTSGNLIQGNWIGLDATGTTALGNGGFGVVVDNLAANTAILGNVISGNTAAGWSASRGGIYLYANGATVQGNRIGTDASGNAFVANGGGSGMSGGIVGRETSANVMIGGTHLGEANVIAGNTGDGVVVEGNATGYTVLGNAIHDNSGLGIDLGHDGVTANDAGDADVGLQNYPTLLSVLSWGGNTVISGELRSQANTSYRVEFFANPAGGADPSGFGEGLTLLGFLDVTTDATGYAAISTTLAGVSVAVGSRISATATSKTGATSYGATSEFGADVAVTPAGAVSVSAISGPTAESGSTATFSVVLTIQPTADVTIALAVSDATEGSLSVSSLTFTAANWNTPQTVTVTGVDDTWVDGNVAYSIVTGAAVSADANYNGVGVADVAVVNTDNDTYNTLVVDTVSDTADGDTASIGALIANRGADGHISLREALLAANATANGSGGPDRIVFNIAGAGAHTVFLSGALPALSDAVLLDGSSQPGYAGAPLIELDGSGAGSSDGLVLGAGSDGSTLTGLAVNRFAGIGIEVASSGNTLSADYVGLRPDGSTAAGNGSDGIRIDNASGNTISHSVVSGNLGAGIALIGAAASGNSVVGSIVGLDATGAAAVGNGLDGIVLSAGAHHNTLGSTTSGQGNVLSGNTGSGIGLYTTHDNQIIGNLIGVDLGGTTALGNGQSGIAANQTVGEIVGGAAAGAGNTISGNAQNGVTLVDASGTVVQGNRIGLDVSGTTLLGNAGAGVALSGSTSGSLVGGTAAGAGNRIAGNQIGVVIGGTSAGNAILANSMYGNTLLGIDLGWDGVTANDTGDGDTGPNGLQNFPVLTYANSTGGNTTLAGSFNSAASTPYRLEFYASATGDASGHGEGQTFLGATTVTTDASGNAVFSVSLIGVSVANGAVVSATATADLGGGSYGGTSEFAANRSATTAGPGVTVTPTAGLATSELGATASFSVVLDSAPVADVVIALSVSDATEGSLSVVSLTFTAANWNQAQTVTVTGVADGIVDGNIAYTVITAQASSADAGYNGLDPADVSLTNFDANPPVITSNGGG
ncbi:MAG TPA: DUF4347 domain-containing protein, partial [Rhodocyclaceae bacterium]|nr:DUF4347 domain-containing protein [Rhodocyclaceae bacterium]